MTHKAVVMETHARVAIVTRWNHSARCGRTAFRAGLYFCCFSRVRYILYSSLEGFPIIFEIWALYKHPTIFAACSTLVIPVDAQQHLVIAVVAWQQFVIPLVAWQHFFIHLDTQQHFVLSSTIPSCTVYSCLYFLCPVMILWIAFLHLGSELLF